MWEFTVGVHFFPGKLMTHIPAKHAVWQNILGIWLLWLPLPMWQGQALDDLACLGLPVAHIHGQGISDTQQPIRPNAVIQLFAMGYLPHIPGNRLMGTMTLQAGKSCCSQLNWKLFCVCWLLLQQKYTEICWPQQWFIGWPLTLIDSSAKVSTSTFCKTNACKRLCNQ